MYNDAAGGSLQERFLTVLRVHPFGISPGFAMQLVRHGTFPEGRRDQARTELYALPGAAWFSVEPEDGGDAGPFPC